MIDPSILSRLETVLTEAVQFGQTSRNLWINGCHQAQSITRIDMASGVLMFPVVGLKHVTSGQRSYIAKPGEVLTLPKGTRCDVKNTPEFGQRRFLGASLVFDADTVELFRKVYADQLPTFALTPKWKAKGANEVYSLISDWVAHDQNYPANSLQTRHRLVEILLILAQQGMAGNLLHSLADTVTDRVAQQFATDLSRDWTIKEIAATLAMSERTLRRRLRAENTGFRAVLEDARLNRGVELVIASDMPIGQIAFECGYQSQSRFAQRFRLRFSMSPTELRATQDRPEAVIIPIDRHRSQH